MAFVASAVASILTLLSFSGRTQPWVPRKPPTPPPTAHELVSPERWPSEPPTPIGIDRAKFRSALAYLCRSGESEVPADELLSAAMDNEVDPFLLAALTFDRSRCDPKFHVRGGYGLLGIQPAMYLHAGSPTPPVPSQDLSPSALLNPGRNLAVGARLLRMWQDDHERLDAMFGGDAHRTGVAHFYWGDEVRNSGNEDLVFTARRRMIARYTGNAEIAHDTPVGLPMICPLEGQPRVATSGPGDDRDGGKRRHRGLDIAAEVGEPVHAAADGVVMFAGANLAGSPRHKLPPSKVVRYRHRRFGAGGIYLCIRHDDAPGMTEAERKQGHVVTCYMHLSSYIVDENERVKAGQTIGFVGVTGVKQSPPHLHFEVRVGDHMRDPARCLTAVVIPPKATKTHQYNVAVHRARIRRERAAARLAASSPGT